MVGIYLFTAHLPWEPYVFMEKFEGQKGISFILLYFSLRDEAYYLPYRDIRYFYDRAADGGRKSFRYDEIDKNYLIRRSQGVPLHFLEALNLDLCSRN